MLITALGEALMQSIDDARRASNHNWWRERMEREQNGR